MSASQPAQWLKRVNYYRKIAGVDPVTEDQSLSQADLAHSRYLMTNYGDAIREGGALPSAAHEEDPNRPAYSETGLKAALNSEIEWGCGSFDPVLEVDRWVAHAFTRIALLDEDLKVAGFGDADKDGCWAAALRLPLSSGPPHEFPKPVEFPPNGSRVPLHFAPGESPNPLVSCPGYGDSVGLPITLELGRLVEAQLGEHSLLENGHPIEHCAFDAPGYRNPSADEQEYGRWALRRSGAIVVIPRAPLKAGATYAVAIRAHGRNYNWSFSVSE